jgi:hypothetical protein
MIIEREKDLNTAEVKRCKYMRLKPFYSNASEKKQKDQDEAVQDRQSEEKRQKKNKKGLGNIILLQNFSCLLIPQVEIELG